MWECPSVPRVSIHPAQPSLISMELEKLSNGNYHHDAAAATVEKGFVFCISSSMLMQSSWTERNPFVLDDHQGSDWSPAKVDHHLSSLISLAIHSLHIECECCWLWRREILSSLHLPCLPNCILPLGLSSCISGLPLDLNLRDINTPVSAATANDDEYVSSRLQELPGIKCSFLSDCECTFSGFCFLDSFRAQPEKDAFLPQKSDGSKTPQFTDVSLSCVHRPQYVVFLVFFQSCFGNAGGKRSGWGGAGYRKPPWPSVY